MPTAVHTRADRIRKGDVHKGDAGAWTATQDATTNPITGAAEVVVEHAAADHPAGGPELVSWDDPADKVTVHRG